MNPLQWLRRTPALSLVFAAALAAMAPPARSATLPAPVGQEVVLGRYYEVKYDAATRQCTVLRAPALMVTQRPERGALSTRRSEEAISHPRCPNLRGPVMTLSYKAVKGASGYDEVSWNVIYQAGQLGSQPYRARMEIRPAAK